MPETFATMLEALACTIEALATMPEAPAYTIEIFAGSGHFLLLSALAKSAGPIVRPMAPTAGEAHGALLLPHEHRHPTHGVLFRPGTGPYTVHHPDPPFRTCFRAFGREEYGVWALTAAVPAYLGYRNSSSLCRGRA